MRHGAPLDTVLALEPVQSVGHARDFEKLPKFQRLVLSGGGPVEAVTGTSCWQGGKNCRSAGRPTEKGRNDAIPGGNPYNKGALQ
jgi:hypothetical protein